MQKTYCDLCGKEIKRESLSGGVMRQREIHQVFQSPNLGIRGLKSPAGVLQTKIVQDIWDLCEDCQRTLWKELEERKEKLEVREK